MQIKINLKKALHKKIVRDKMFAVVDSAIVDYEPQVFQDVDNEPLALRTTLLIKPKALRGFFCFLRAHTPLHSGFAGKGKKGKEKL